MELGRLRQPPRGWVAVASCRCSLLMLPGRKQTGSAGTGAETDSEESWSKCFCTSGAVFSLLGPREPGVRLLLIGQSYFQASGMSLGQDHSLQAAMIVLLEGTSSQLWVRTWPPCVPQPSTCPEAAGLDMCARRTHTASSHTCTCVQRQGYRCKCMHAHRLTHCPSDPTPPSLSSNLTCPSGWGFSSGTEALALAEEAPPRTLPLALWYPSCLW